MEVSQKTKNRITLGLSNSTPGYIYKKKKQTLIQEYTCTPTFIGALFTIAKVWKQTKCLSTDECIRKIHTIECFWAIKKGMKSWNQHECTYRVFWWVKLSQTEKDKHCMHSHTKSEKN